MSVPSQLKPGQETMTDEDVRALARAVSAKISAHPEFVKSSNGNLVIRTFRRDGNGYHVDMNGSV